MSTDLGGFPPAPSTATLSNGIPSFSVYSTISTVVPNTTFTKVQLNTARFDTAGYFDLVNNRFFPLLAGQYQINSGVFVRGSSLSYALSSIFLNGARFKDGTYGGPAGGIDVNSHCSDLISFNGVTDFIDLEVFASGSSVAVQAGEAFAYMSGFWVRPL